MPRPAAQAANENEKYVNEVAGVHFSDNFCLFLFLIPLLPYCFAALAPHKLHSAEFI